MIRKLCEDYLGGISGLFDLATLNSILRPAGFKNYRGTILCD
jgi:hypothetical protein